MTTMIRTAAHDDLPALMALYTHLGRNNAERADLRAIETFARILEAPGMHLFLLEDNGDARASCYLNVIDNLTHGAQPYALIENAVTHSDARRRGFARAVLQHAVAFAWSAGCYKVMLMTGKADNVAFYEACGFDASEKHALIVRRPANA